MIRDIEIKNYKKFDRNGIFLANLTGVNYFVGENSSGKSTILDYIYDLGEKSDNVFLLKSGLDASKALESVDIQKACSRNDENQWKNLFLDFLDRRVLVLDLLGYVLVHNSKDSHAANLPDIELARKFLSDIGIDTPKLRNINTKEADTEEMSGGKQKIFNLVYSILFIHKVYKDDAVILIEEPSEHLHPSWQKRLPEIFQAIYAYTGIQIFVSTHSPFVISGAGILTEGQRVSQVSQKVYFLKNFRIAGKRGEPSPKGKNGYWGSKVVQITSKMLGAGLMDLVSSQSANMTADAPTLVVCEGEGIEEDAKVYNTIFDNRRPPVLFVSSRGSSQVYRTFSLLNDIKPGLAANFNMIMLRDRDHEFPDLESIEKCEEINPNHRILRRRAVECYIYNSEVAEKLLEHFGMKLNNKGRMELDRLNDQIQSEVERGVPDNTYKQRLSKVFDKVTGNKLLEFSEGGDIMVDLADLITPDMQAYKDLEVNIFGG